MAKEAPIPMGKTAPRIYQSLGAEPYIMNHYSTTSSVAYAKPHIEYNKFGKKIVPPSINGEKTFESTVAAKFDVASGFTSNERPFLSYTRTLDNLDNPDLGIMLEGNYNTTTHLDYRGYYENDGFETLPVSVQDLNSGYAKDAIKNNLILPPEPFKDESRPAHPDGKYISVGPKEISGFVNNQDMTVPFNYSVSAKPGQPFNLDNQNKLILPSVSTMPATKCSSFARELVPTKMPEMIDQVKPTGKKPESLAWKNLDVGSKETGQTRCEQGYLSSKSDKRDFLTNYQLNFCDKVAKFKDREGYVVGGINSNTHLSIYKGNSKATSGGI